MRCSHAAQTKEIVEANREIFNERQTEIGEGNAGNFEMKNQFSLVNLPLRIFVIS